MDEKISKLKTSLMKSRTKYIVNSYKMETFTDVAIDSAIYLLYLWLYNTCDNVRFFDDNG